MMKSCEMVALYCNGRAFEERWKGVCIAFKRHLKSIGSAYEERLKGI